jgi:hypothetical protein
MEACRGQQWQRCNLHDGYSKSEIVNVRLLASHYKTDDKAGEKRSKIASRTNRVG